MSCPASSRRTGRMLLLAVLSGAAVAPAAEVSVDSQAAAEFRQHVVYLASEPLEGRGAGTAGIALARDYLAAHFKALGLGPAFGDGYTQEFRIRTGVKAERQELAMAGADGRPAVRATAGTDFLPMGFSADGAFSGPAVFVGYGIRSPERDFDSFGGRGRDALAGKVAVAFRYEPHDENGKSLWARSGGAARSGSWTSSASLTGKAAAAAQHGAAALLIVNPPRQNKGNGPRPVSFTALGSRARIPVLHADLNWFRRVLQAAGRDPAAEADRLVGLANRGQGTPADLGVTLKGAVALQDVRSPVHNVATVLEGRGDLAGEFIVVGAHYDHVGYGEVGSRLGGRQHVIHPGADDNASGTAGVMMLAKWFRQRSRAAPAPRRSLLFVAFAGEERGLLGSSHLVGHLKELGIARDQIAAMINMDMIGRLRDGRLAVWGADSGDRWREIVEAAAAGAELKLRMVGPGFGPSDHTSFYRVKVPVLGFNTGVHRDLHAPTDTADKIDPDGAIRVLRLIEKVIERLWTDPKRIRYVPPRPGGRAYVGVVPQADGEGGVELARVLPGGPADQAGLKAGDVIVRWNGKAVGTVNDLLVRLGTHKPGDAVKLEVRRGDERIEVVLKLGQR